MDIPAARRHAAGILATAARDEAGTVERTGPATADTRRLATALRRLAGELDRRAGRPTIEGPDAHPDQDPLPFDIDDPGASRP